MHHIIIEGHATHTFQAKHGQLGAVLSGAPRYTRDYFIACVGVDISRAKDICLDVIYYMCNIWLYNTSKCG
jgi:hypothetical protein